MKQTIRRIVKIDVSDAFVATGMSNSVYIAEHSEFLMFMTSTQIGGLLYNQTEQESTSEAFVPVVSE